MHTISLCPIRSLLLAALCCCVHAQIGCGGRPADSSGTNDPVADSSSSAPAPAARPIARIDREGLPIGQYLPWLDGERVRIAVPEGWRTLPRDSDYLVRFYDTDRNGLPRINVRVDDADLGTLTNSTPENVRELAQSVTAQLRQDGSDDIDVYPMVIGTQACVAYVAQVGLQLSPESMIRADRQRIVTVQNARRYTIDLLTLPQLGNRSRPSVYAVVASLEFGGDSDRASPMLPESTAAEVDPAEPAAP